MMNKIILTFILLFTSVNVQSSEDYKRGFYVGLCTMSTIKTFRSSFEVSQVYCDCVVNEAKNHTGQYHLSGVKAGLSTMIQRKCLRMFKLDDKKNGNET